MIPQIQNFIQAHSTAIATAAVGICTAIAVVACRCFRNRNTAAAAPAKATDLKAVELKPVSDEQGAAIVDALCKHILETKRTWEFPAGKMNSVPVWEEKGAFRVPAKKKWLNEQEALLYKAGPSIITDRSAELCSSLDGIALTSLVKRINGKIENDDVIKNLRYLPELLQKVVLNKECGLDEGPVPEAGENLLSTAFNKARAFRVIVREAITPEEQEEAAKRGKKITAKEVRFFSFLQDQKLAEKHPQLVKKDITTEDGGAFSYYSTTEFNTRVKEEDLEQAEEEKKLEAPDASKFDLGDFDQAKEYMTLAKAYAAQQ